MMARWTGIIYDKLMKFNPHFTQREVSGYYIVRGVQLMQYQQIWEDMKDQTKATS